MDENKVEVVENTKKGIGTIIKEFFSNIGSWLWGHKLNILKGAAVFAAGVAAGNTILSGAFASSEDDYDCEDYSDDVDDTDGVDDLA